jgi:hypothetical protein
MIGCAVNFFVIGAAARRRGIACNLAFLRSFNGPDWVAESDRRAMKASVSNGIALVFCCLSLLIVALGSSKASPPIVGFSRKSVWFSPESHYPPAKNSDFLQLFAFPGLWRNAASRIGVLKLSTQFYVAAPVTILRSVVSSAELYHIRLAVEAEVQCPRGGFSPNELAQRVVEKVESAGGTISAVSMDGALFTIGTSGGSNGCGSYVGTAATSVASVLSVYKNAFPDVTVGDIIPVPEILRVPHWSDTMNSFYTALHSRGFKVSYIDLDFNWRDVDVTKFGDINKIDEGRLVEATAKVSAEVKHLRKGLGFIVDGKANATSNKMWTDQAEQNFVLVDKAAKPDRLVFQSWHSYPNTSLPDSSLDSFTGLIRHFPQLSEPTADGKPR